MHVTLTVRFVLQVVALICFVLAAAGVNAGRISLTPLGLGLWLLSEMVT